MLTYQTPAGNAPVDDYITGLEGTAAAKAAALVKLLEARGYELRLPHSRSLGEGCTNFEMLELASDCSTCYYPGIVLSYSTA